MKNNSVFQQVITDYANVIRGVLLLYIVICTVSCQQQLPTESVEPTANLVFEDLKRNDVDTALTHYSEDFFKNIPKEQWRSSLQTFREKMGPIDSYRIRSKQADTRFSGKFYIFKFETVHKKAEKMEKAEHVVTFILPVNEPELKLIAHKITAKGIHNSK